MAQWYPTNVGSQAQTVSGYGGDFQRLVSQARPAEGMSDFQRLLQQPLSLPQDFPKAAQSFENAGARFLEQRASRALMSATSLALDIVPWMLADAAALTAQDIIDGLERPVMSDAQDASPGGPGGYQLPDGWELLSTCNEQNQVI